MTVSGPIWTSSEYKNFSRAKNAAGSTSGSSISVWVIAIPPLNIASKTALPMDSTNLWAGILCVCGPLPTLKWTSDMISLLNINASLSFRVAFVDCQLYTPGSTRGCTGGIDGTLCSWLPGGVASAAASSCSCGDAPLLVRLELVAAPVSMDCSLFSVPVSRRRSLWLSRPWLWFLNLGLPLRLCPPEPPLELALKYPATPLALEFLCRGPCWLPRLRLWCPSCSWLPKLACAPCLCPTEELLLFVLPWFPLSWPCTLAPACWFFSSVPSLRRAFLAVFEAPLLAPASFFSMANQLGQFIWMQFDL